MLYSPLLAATVNKLVFVFVCTQCIQTTLSVCSLGQDNSFINLLLVEQRVKDVGALPYPKALSFVLPPGKCTKMESPFERDIIYDIFNTRVEMNGDETSRVLGPVYHDELNIMRLQGVHGAELSELDTGFNVGYSYLGPGESSLHY